MDSLNENFDNQHAKAEINHEIRTRQKQILFKCRFKADMKMKHSNLP